MKKRIITKLGDIFCSQLRDGCKLNEDSVPVGKLPQQYIKEIELGQVFPFSSIIDRMQYGYYMGTYVEYDIIQRVPRKNVHSYIRKEYNEKKEICYFHFVGNEAVCEIIVHAGKVVKLSKEEPCVEGYVLYQDPFGKENWNHSNFLTEEEFKQVAEGMAVG